MKYKSMVIMGTLGAATVRYMPALRPPQHDKASGTIDYSSEAFGLPEEL